MRNCCSDCRGGPDPMARDDLWIQNILSTVNVPMLCFISIHIYNVSFSQRSQRLWNLYYYHRVVTQIYANLNLKGEWLIWGRPRLLGADLHLFPVVSMSFLNQLVGPSVVEWWPSTCLCWIRGCCMLTVPLCWVTAIQSSVMHTFLLMKRIR